MVLILVIATAAACIALKVIHFIFFRTDNKQLDTGETEQWFGIGTEDRSDDVSIRPFKVNIPDSVLLDLKDRLAKTRFEAPLQDAKFHYGFNSNYLQQVVQFWKDEFDWRKQEEKINSFNHFKTHIHGLDVHFVHVKPVLPPGSNVKVVPLLMVHGWPGSFFEFFKIIPLLVSPRNGFAFEVVCPSIPGYGFSEAPRRKGFDARAAACVFHILMKERLGHEKYFVQGGDWGSFIGSVIAHFYPQSVLGLHLNMFGVRPSVWNRAVTSVLSHLPFLMSRTEYDSFSPSKRAAFVENELGYYRIQSTKPDTIGCGMTDSPAGLAAYILEKFSTWANPDNRDLDDGGLCRTFALEDLLTNVTIYWVGNNFTSAARFYRENAALIATQKLSPPIVVPFGMALFPKELGGSPRILVLLSDQVRDLVSYTVMPRGGHFAAFEEPQLLAEDIWNFVHAVRKRKL